MFKSQSYRGFATQTELSWCFQRESQMHEMGIVYAHAQNMHVCMQCNGQTFSFAGNAMMYI